MTPLSLRHSSSGFVNYDKASATLEQKTPVGKTALVPVNKRVGSSGNTKSIPPQIRRRTITNQQAPTNKPNQLKADDIAKIFGT